MLNHDEQRLIEGLRELGLQPVNVEPFLQYLALLDKWNQRHNLTAIRDLDTMVIRHLLDSLAIVPWITGTRILDVGTGPGLPGIPLALYLPHLHFVLLDSHGKKIAFLNAVKRHLKLHNVDIVQSRAEEYHPTERFDVIVSRALTDLNQFVTWTSHLIAPHSTWLAMKGRYPETELATLHQPYQVIPYKVPGLLGERCCIIIKNATKDT